MIAIYSMWQLYYRKALFDDGYGMVIPWKNENDKGSSFVLPVASFYSMSMPILVLYYIDMRGN